VRKYCGKVLEVMKVIPSNFIRVKEKLSSSARISQLKNKVTIIRNIF
jgi:hypothetical protein